MDDAQMREKERGRERALEYSYVLYFCALNISLTIRAYYRLDTTFQRVVITLATATYVVQATKMILRSPSAGTVSGKIPKL